MFSLERTCKNFCHLLGAYADGELEPSAVCAIEEHVTECEGCRERVELDRAIRGSLKRTVRTSAPEGLRARAAAAMMAAKAAEVAKKDARARDLERASASASWRTIVPLASAAALAMVWGAATRGPLNQGRPSGSPDSVRAGFGDELLEELVLEHSRPLPPERTDPVGVRGFEKYVGVPVHTGGFGRGTTARLVGGRLLPLHQERAAVLQYEIGNGAEVRRVSVVIYDPRRIQVNDENVSPRDTGGVNVAFTQHAGVGYACASARNQDCDQFAANVGDE
ncbi:MAG: zf-HC2 domain-containing protein [Polyangiaceae bacterium]